MNEEYIKAQLEPVALTTFTLLEQLLDWAKIEDLNGRKTIEVGCGNGAFIDLLNDRGCTRVIGVDMNPIYVNRKGITKGLQEELPFEDESFDLYISSQTLEHSYDFKKSISEMFRVLRKEGIALISLPWGEQHADTLIHCAARPLGLAEITPEKTLSYFKDNQKVSTVRHEILMNGKFMELRILIKLK